jgi:hypothetical protein
MEVFEIVIDLKLSSKIKSTINIFLPNFSESFRVRKVRLSLKTYELKVVKEYPKNPNSCEDLLPIRDRLTDRMLRQVLAFKSIIDEAVKFD